MLQRHRHGYRRVFNTCSVSNTSVSTLQKYHTDSYCFTSVCSSYTPEGQWTQQLSTWAQRGRPLTPLLHGLTLSACMLLRNLFHHVSSRFLNRFHYRFLMEPWRRLTSRSTQSGVLTFRDPGHATRQAEEHQLFCGSTWEPTFLVPKRYRTTSEQIKPD